MIKVDNAIIMAAGTASRFAPLSYEKPKALVEVKGEVLIERQIKQLIEAGIKQIYIVVGYKKELFYYLQDKYSVKIVENSSYATRNNNASIYAVKNYIRNSYICSADNYFTTNPFSLYEEDCYYSALYSKGKTNEWCLYSGEDGYINKITVGGNDCWYMLGHAFWTEQFSKKFVKILDEIYDKPETTNMYWEDILINYISQLKMKIKPYDNDVIYEFDSLDELRTFDTSYINNTRSKIIKDIAKDLLVSEKDIVNIKSFTDKNNIAAGFTFNVFDKHYKFAYESKQIENI